MCCYGSIFNSVFLMLYFYFTHFCKSSPVFLSIGQGVYFFSREFSAFDEQVPVLVLQ